MKKLLLVALLSWPMAGFAQHWVTGVRVTIAPPALRFESPGMAPSSRHQWIGGYWAWRGGRHAWMGGHWALPPGSGYVWQPAQWEQQNGAWVFYEGHWRASEAPDQTVVFQPPPPPVQPQVVDVAPPQPIEEVRPAVPWGGAVWIPGFWNWNGERHVWVSGRWSAQPAGYIWDEHRWRHREDGRWEHQEGHWHPREWERGGEHRDDRGEHDRH